MSIHHIIEQSIRDGIDASGRAQGIAAVVKARFRPDEYEYRLCTELEELMARHHKELCRMARSDAVLVTPDEVETWAVHG